MLTVVLVFAYCMQTLFWCICMLGEKVVVDAQAGSVSEIDCDGWCYLWWFR
jgi:hypothetical protein